MYLTIPELTLNNDRTEIKPYMYYDFDDKF